MKLNILIGGEAGQGINKISEIVSDVLVSLGYFTFNYRDYPSLIRGGHNFNVLSISEKRVGSIESTIDGIVALDDKTYDLHKAELKKDGFFINHKDFDDLGKDLNLALSGALIRVLGIDEKILDERIKKEFDNPEAIAAAKKGFQSQKPKFSFVPQNKKISIMNGSRGVALGAVNSGIDLYFGYPMTPATGVMNELAEQKDKKLEVIQPENEIAAVSEALGASFAGAKAMTGSSGGGFDLMAETLSMQGGSELPLVVYLASRCGPGTGAPTYTAQGDLEDALRAGHGEFPRVVAAPGDPIEAAEITNEMFYLSQKFKCLAIVLSDKHLAESEFSSDKATNPVIEVKVERALPGKTIVKASSYEHNEEGNTVSDADLIEKNAKERIKRYGLIKDEVKNFDMIKIYGKEDSKNLVVGWGSTKTAILDAIEGEDIKFLQVLYLKPLSNQIKDEIVRAKNVVLVENNLTGQLGSLIRQKTGKKIENRILKFDGRPFFSDQLKAEIKRFLI